MDMTLLYSLITAQHSKSVGPDEAKKAQLRQHRQVERQARRRRRDARQREGISPDQHHEGLSTDEEEKESDKQGFVPADG